MELKFRRKILQKKTDYGYIRIPPIFLENMNALDVKEAFVSVADRDHILIELIREDQHEKSN